MYFLSIALGAGLVSAVRAARPGPFFSPVATKLGRRRRHPRRRHGPRRRARRTHLGRALAPELESQGVADLSDVGDAFLLRDQDVFEKLLRLPRGAVVFADHLAQLATEPRQQPRFDHRVRNSPSSTIPLLGPALELERFGLADREVSTRHCLNPSLHQWRAALSG